MRVMHQQKREYFLRRAAELQLAASATTTPAVSEGYRELARTFRELANETPGANSRKPARQIKLATHKGVDERQPMRNTKSDQKWRSGGWWIGSIYLALLAGIAGIFIYAMTQRADAPDFPTSATTGENINR
jgi:hypothetical protein